MSVTASSSQSHYASTFNLQVHNLYVTVVLTIAVTTAGLPQSTWKPTGSIM